MHQVPGCASAEGEFLCPPRLASMLLLAHKAPLAASMVMLLLFVVRTCDIQAQVQPTRPVPPYQVLPPSKVHQVHLTPLMIYRLPTDTVSPVRIVDALTWGSSLYVLDGEGRRLFRYSRNGTKLTFAVGKWGSTPGSFDVPRRMEVSGESLLVLDATHRQAFSSFDSVGRFLGRRLKGLSEVGGTAFVLVGKSVAIAVLTPRTLGSDTGTVVVANQQGQITAVGCKEDPQYNASRARGGELATYAFRGIALRRDQIFCSQPISPVIEVFDTAGRSVGSIRVAPPFYLAPHDTSYSGPSTRKDELKYESGWMAHSGVYVGPTTFISVYSHYDTLQGSTRFFLFKCHLTADLVVSNCQTGESPGRPIRFRPPDTLFVAMPPKPGRNTIPWIGVFGLSK